MVNIARIPIGIAITLDHSVTPHAYPCAPLWFIPRCHVLDSLHKLSAEKWEDVISDIIGATVVFVIVGSTIRLLLSDAHTVLSHVGSVIH
jgi:hypothetical protein